MLEIDTFNQFCTRFDLNMWQFNYPLEYMNHIIVVSTKIWRKSHLAILIMWEDDFFIFELYPIIWIILLVWILRMKKHCVVWFMLTKMCHGIPHILLNNIYYKLKRTITLNIYYTLKILCIFLFIEWQYFNFHDGPK